MPDSIGRYEIKAELGRGGFGRVYRAWDPTVGRMVAIKTLNAGGDPELLQRFRNEAAAAGKLRHRNIVVIHDFGEAEGEPYIVMELLEGEDLHRVMQAQRSLTLLQKMQIMVQVAEGLDHAHRNGVVHRDVKPANMMLLPDNTVKLMDFGIALVTQVAGARLTKTGTVPGTLKYMAPEQFRGASNDLLSDIFAYGVTYYELVSGRHPFDGPAQPAIMFNILSADPAPLHEVCPECPEALSQVIHRCLQKERENRYPSLDDLLFDTLPVLVELRGLHAKGMLAEAQRLATAGQQETANALLREVLELDPANRTARDLRELLQTEIRRRVIRPKVEEMLHSGRQRLVAREFAEAIQAAESALRLDRSSEDALALMAQARSGKQQAEDAGKLVQQARSALSSDNLTGAYQLVNEALQFDPHHPEGGQLIERVRESIALREHDRRCSEGISRARGSLLIEAFDDALTQLERLQREYPDNAEIPRLLGEARAAQQQHQRKVRIASEVTACKEKLKARAFDDAVSRLETLDREFPETTEIRDLLSYAREERKAKKRQETIERLMREVAQLEQQSNYDAAIQMLERGLGYYPGDLTIDRRLQAMRLARTAWIRQQALDLALEQGESLRAEGRYTEALRAVDVFRASHGNDEPRVETLRVSIEAEWQENKRANAVRTFTEEVERLLSGGEVGTAVRVAEKALALYPEDALRAILTKAQDALRAHQRAEAVGRLMSQAQDLTRTQKYDHALKVIEQGLKEFPDDSGLQRAQTAALGAKDSFERAQAARKAIAQAKAMLAVQKNADAVSACQAVLNRYAGTDFEERRELLALIEQAEAAVREKEARESAISKLLEQARGLCAERKFDAAIAALDQGLRNYANDVRVAQARQDAYVARDVHDRRVSLMAIREGLSTGRLADAERLLSTAVSRFAGDPEFKGLQEDLRQRMRRAAVDALVSDAEGKAAAGEFDSALRLLEQGRSVYQSEPALDELFRKVQERKKQYDREIGLQNALENIQESLLFERLDDAAEAIAATRKSYGPDPRIDAAGKDLADRQELRRKADAEQQRQEGINRAVREAGALASAGKHEQATRFLDDAIKQYPGEQALLRAKENVEQARRRYVAQKIAEACRAAEQQLTRGQFDEASATLSQAESTYGTDPGIAAVRSSLTEARARADAELGRQEEERRRIEEARRQREEEGRKKAEEERLRKAEADRQRQEQERLRAAEEEKERQEKERLRKIAEEKQRQEEDRLRQEELKRRQEAERARVEAERVKAEAERVRLEAERAKAEAERLRLEAERKQKEEEQQRRREAEAARAAAISSLVEQASKLQAQNQFDAAISHIDRALTAYRDEPALIRARDAAATAKSEYLRQQAVTAAVSEARAQMARGEIESAVAGAEAAIRQYPGEAALTRVLREAQQALEKKKAEEAARQKREGDVAELRSLLERASASSNKGDRKNFTKRASAIAAAWKGDSEIAALAAQVQNAPMPVSATPAPVAEPIRTPSPVSISDVAPPPKSSPMKWIAAAVLVVVAGGVGYVATRPSPEVKETPPKKEEPPPKVEAKKEVKKKEEPPIETPPPPPVEVAQGTLIVATGIGGVDIYVDAKRVGVTNSSGALQLPLEAKDYRIRAEKSGYQTVAPQQVTIAKNARKQVSFKLNPAEATLVLQGATAGATVKLDARSVGTVGADGSFSVTVPAGDHVVEFTKDQFQSRLLRRMFEPGQRVVLERNEVALTAIPKVDPQAAVSQEWERMKNSRDLGQLEDFARRNSSNPLAKLALDRVQDLRWQGVDKNNPAALRDYAAKNPNSPFAKTALDTALRLEWDAVDKSDQRALQAFRQKNANTEYAARATKELDRLEQSLAAGKKQADAKATAERINAERSEILQTLRKFTSGVEAKNLSAMVAAYPGIDRRLWQRSLSEVQSMKWTLTPLNEPEVQDTSATVTCNRSTTTVARNGQTQSLPATRVTVKLVKSSSGWVIEDIK